MEQLSGSAECRKHGTVALIPRSSGHGTHPSNAERASATQAAWGGGRHKTARSAVREQGRSKTGIASLPHVKLAPMCAPGPTGERQEHLDAIIAFAVLDSEDDSPQFLHILTVKWASGGIPEECRFLPNLQLILKKEKDPTTKIFVDL